jgi:hypothetical protein
MSDKSADREAYFQTAVQVAVVVENFLEASKYRRKFLMAQLKEKSKLFHEAELRYLYGRK